MEGHREWYPKASPELPLWRAHWAFRMSPIRQSEKTRYPEDWRKISDRIRFERAGGRCECDGTCGATSHAIHDGRCAARHNDPLPNGWRVILTTAHLDHQPENITDENLRAMCQKCHLNYDKDHHAETRRVSINAAAAAEMSS